MSEVRQARHQNRRQGGMLIAENRSRLLQVTRRESQLMNQCRREHMRIIQPERVRLKRIMDAERWKVRDAAQQFERIVCRVTIELVFQKGFVGGVEPVIETKSKRI